MPAPDGREPIEDDEIVFRRVPNNIDWYNPESQRPVAWVTFRPNPKDTDGISVWRAKYKSPEEVAAIHARLGRQYWVLALKTSQLRNAGITIAPTPDLGGPGHASLTNMRSSDYAQNRNTVKNIAEDITRNLVLYVEGPFTPCE